MNSVIDYQMYTSPIANGAFLLNRSIAKVFLEPEL